MNTYKLYIGSLRVITERKKVDENYSYIYHKPVRYVLVKYKNRECYKNVFTGEKYMLLDNGLSTVGLLDRYLTSFNEYTNNEKRFLSKKKVSKIYNNLKLNNRG